MKNIHSLNSGDALKKGQKSKMAEIMSDFKLISKHSVICTVNQTTLALIFLRFIVSSLLIGMSVIYILCPQSSLSGLQVMNTVS